MRWTEITETTTPENIDEALWWVIRYVSGSLTDPDWDWGEPTHFDINSAMEVAGKYIGNRKSVGKPLSRYLLLDEGRANKLSKTKMLQPNGSMVFQSFTTGGVAEAMEIGRFINHNYGSPGLVEVVVTLTPPPNDVLFGVADVAASHKPGVDELHGQWEDWHHQNEVFVKVTQPLPCTVTVMPTEGTKNADRGVD